MYSSILEGLPSWQRLTLVQKDQSTTVLVVSKHVQLTAKLPSYLHHGQVAGRDQLLAATAANLQTSQDASVRSPGLILSPLLGLSICLSLRSHFDLFLFPRTLLILFLLFLSFLLLAKPFSFCGPFLCLSAFALSTKFNTVFDQKQEIHFGTSSTRCWPWFWNAILLDCLLIVHLFSFVREGEAFLANAQLLRQCDLQFQELA
mmetsp:Transcript_20167/g.44522  ORF Transcript_20167/g.44522 Transcript_20167/m.44522 type:complete len:203 (-) Transcript_20167:232-840(-)